jgi:hypothetical protein
MPVACKPELVVRRGPPCCHFGDAARAEGDVYIVSIISDWQQTLIESMHPMSFRKRLVSRAKKVLEVLAGLALLFCLVAAGGTVYDLWSRLWNPDPRIMSLEQYITSGSDRDWVILKHCYVGQSLKFDLEDDHKKSYDGYWPLRVNQHDTGPSKVFLIHRQGGSLIGEFEFLSKRGESYQAFATRYREAQQRYDHSGELLPQDVSGMFTTSIFGVQRSDDEVRGRVGRKDITFLKHNAEPPSRQDAEEDALACLAGGLLAALLGWLAACADRMVEQ